MERVMGIEPTLSAWEADVLPLNYTRSVSNIQSVNSIRTSWHSIRSVGPVNTAITVANQSLQAREDEFIL